MTEEGAVWVGVLDMDTDEHVVGVSGPVGAQHQHARVMVTMHRAPIGYVSLPTLPVDTLTARARREAGSTLADALRRHAERDDSASGPATGDWSARVGCPRHFPGHSAEGITVIICTRDRAEGLRQCLRTVQRAEYEPLEILVVDNAPSGDATRELVTSLAREDSRIRYSCEPLPGLSRARNHGLAHARFDMVAFTDDDTLVDPGWPSAVAAGFAADPEAVCITGLVASSALDTGPQRYFDARYSWGEIFEPRRFDLGEHRDPSRLYPFSAGIFGTGANFAVRASAVTRLGGFDPLLGAGGPGRGGEDLDMFLRVILAGGRICYLPSALVWHRHRAEAKLLGDQIYSYGYGLGAYLAKHLLNRQLPTAMLRRGFRQSGVVMGRMRQASQVSHLGTGGKLLALTEVWGVMAGILRYVRAARWSSGPHSGVR